MLPAAARRLPVALALSLAALVAALPAAPSAHAASRKLGTRTLEQGDRGSDVKALQRLLARAGFRTKPDGVFGAGTARIQRLVERELSMRVDGRASRADVARVRAAISRSRGTGGYGATTEAEDRAQEQGGKGRGQGDGAAAAGAAASDAPATTTPGAQAQLTPDGLAVAPEDAPDAVKRVIAAGNAIATKPYRYGGGHGRWEDTAYDCSGSVSYALHGGGLLDQSMPSGSFTSWGTAGAGRWITLYANGGHIYMTVAGLRFDTSGRARGGSRWQRETRSPSGYTVRHPTGF